MDGATFWTAVGSIAGCVAAVATILALLRSRKTAKFIQLRGRLNGKLGDQWDFVADLEVKDGKAEGKICWTLVECPPSVPWARKVRAHGFELVEGVLKRGVLELSGTKVVGEAAEVMALCDYTIPLPASGKNFQGEFRTQKRGKYLEAGTLHGEVVYLARPPQHAD
jgi:hypothetical protein